MKNISVGYGLYAIVDDEDYDTLNSFGEWNFSFGYAVKRHNRSTISMARKIMKAPPELEVDHINRNRLDNRKENLRLCDKYTNLLNKGKYRTKNKYIGVYRYSGKWATQMTIDGKTYTFAYFNDPVEAAVTRDSIAKQIYNGLIALNFEGV